MGPVQSSQAPTCRWRRAAACRWSEEGRRQRIAKGGASFCLPLVLLLGSCYLVFTVVASLDVGASAKESARDYPTSVSTPSSSSSSQLEQINLNLRALASAQPHSLHESLLSTSREVHPESASSSSSAISNSTPREQPKVEQLLVHSDLSSSSPPSPLLGHIAEPTATPSYPLLELEKRGQAIDSAPPGWLMLLVGAHVSYKLFTLALQSAAVLSSVAMQLTPAPTILSVSKSRSTGDLEPLPYVMLSLSAILWTMYGVLKQDLIICLPNSIGIFLGIVYVTTYRNHCNNTLQRSCLNFYMKGSAGVVVALAVVTVFGGLQRGTTLVGLSAAFFNVISYAAPLSSLGRVLRDKSTASMPYEMSVGSLVCSICWMIYGFVIHDNIILIPSMIGAFVGFMQLGLLIAYPSRTGFQPLKGRTDLSCSDRFKNAATPTAATGGGLSGYDDNENLAEGRPPRYMTADDVYGSGGGARKAKMTVIDEAITADTAAYHEDTVIPTSKVRGMRYLADVVRHPWRGNGRGNGSTSPVYHDCDEAEDPCTGIGEADFPKTNTTTSPTRINFSGTSVDQSAIAALDKLPNVSTPSTTTSSGHGQRASSAAFSPVSNACDQPSSFAGSLVGYIFPPTPSNRMSHRFNSTTSGHAGIVVPSICDTSGRGLTTHDTLLKHVFGQSADLQGAPPSPSQATR
eukprot:GHVS01090870.1.p1 GENE.GHVS01090870.1~~GHVS01090870.1.p1  ORF type:complete len:686 (-),score=96.60 GHVS01090870.1:516-2573(-)